MPNRVVRIGGASAGFIDSAIAVPQLLKAGVDYLAFDCMGEGNMPILARRLDENSGTGYMAEFLEHLRANLGEIVAKGVRVVANAGGLDPRECALAIERLAAELGLSPVVAYVEGDNILDRADALRATGYRDMFSGAAFPEQRITTANVYLGALPIAEALSRGAQIVVTGRVVDSAATLGPLIHEFGWSTDDYDRLSAGTLIGHLLECGAQASGGIFTDWEDVPDWENVGYPIAECHADGSAIITKSEEAGGLVSVGTVSEQLLYEVSDPQRYFVPDVTCDFSEVRLEQVGENRVRVSNARGYPPTSTYKALLTYDNGWRGFATFVVSGEDAVRKVERIGQALIDRTQNMLRQRNLGEWNRTRVEAIGAEGSYGANAQPLARQVREVVCRVVADHERPEAAAILVSEQFTAGISMAPGNSCVPLGLGVMPLFRLFPVLIEKELIKARVVINEAETVVAIPTGGGFRDDQVKTLSLPQPAALETPVTVNLQKLAWVRSGDKGNISNIAVIARKADYLPFLRAALTESAVAAWYAHLFEDGQAGEVHRYEAPSLNALNFTLHEALEGGITASLRFDPMGKALGQQLLRFPVPVTAEVAQRF